MISRLLQNLILLSGFSDTNLPETAGRLQIDQVGLQAVEFIRHAFDDERLLVQCGVQPHAGNIGSQWIGDHVQIILTLVFEIFHVEVVDSEKLSPDPLSFVD